MHFYSHNIGDFNNSTRHLTRVERSLYRDLIELYYDTEQPFQSVDFNRLAKRVLAQTNEELDALAYVLEEFFHELEGTYNHIRCDIEIAKYHANTSAKAKAGIASAKARQTKKQQNSTGVEQVLNTDSTDEQLNNNHKPLTNNKANNTVKRSSTEVAEVFECWQDTMKHPQSKLDDKRKKLIRSGLKIGYSVSDLKQAIIGCSLTPHNIGQNDRGQRYDGLNIILKSSDNIERFIENSRSPPKLALITATSQRGSGIQKMKELAGIR